MKPLACTYGVDALVAGCTEVHLAARHIAEPHASEQPFEILDPLTSIAKQWMESETHEQSIHSRSL